MRTMNVLFFQYPWRLWRERFAGVYRYAKKAKWQVSVAEYGRNFESIPAALRFWCPDGLIVEGGYTELADFRQSDFRGYPVVFCDARASRMHRSYSGVAHDSSETAMLAAKELLSLGFSDYAFVKERMAAVGFADGICANLFSAEELGALKPCPRPFLDIAAALAAEQYE